MILRLHDRVVVVVEVVRQHRRAGVRSERQQAAIGQRPRLRVIELAEFRRRGGARAQPLLGFGGQRRQPPGRRVDDDRAPRHAVDADHLVARIEPEAVVAADLPARGFGNPLDERRLARRLDGEGLAALGHRRPVGIACLVELLGKDLGARLDRRRFVCRQRRALLAHALERRLRFVGPVALEVRFAVGRARHDPRFGFGRRGLCGKRRPNSREHDDGQCDDTGRAAESRNHGVPFWVKPTDESRQPLMLARISRQVHACPHEFPSEPVRTSGMISP